MQHLAAVALVLGISAAPAAAQLSGTSEPQGDFSLAVREPMLAPRSRGFEFPVTQYVDQGGAVQQQRGIVLGREVAPGALIGIGMFDRTPKSRGLVPQLDAPPAARKSRGAAVGLKLRF